MLKKVVRFVINKEDVMIVINNLSSYGTVEVATLKDGIHYCVTVKCGRHMLQRCLDILLSISRNGVYIQRIGLTTEIGL